VREAFANELAGLEHRLEDGLERAAVTLPEIANAIHFPSPDKVQKIADEAAELRRAGRTVDSELVIVTARQTPVASDLRLVLALIEVAHHSTLIANQFDLISEQLVSIDAAAVNLDGTASHLYAMPHLAGSQLSRAVRAFRSRDLTVALRIDVEDDEIDKLNREVFAAALKIEDPPEQHELALRHVLIARSIERIADNAVDIAEQAAFLVTAERSEFTDASIPRHRTLDDPHDANRAR
jgi:phosphate transport system protein